MARTDYSGNAGHVVTRRNRITHNDVSVYRAEEALLDTEAGPWAIICEPHGSIVNTSTRANAVLNMAYPDWCEDCRDLLP